MTLFGIKENINCKIIYVFGFKIKIKKALNTEDVLNLLNSITDIRNCPCARGKLRKLQIADTLLMKIFHNICKKYGVQYFLSWGSLLGAVRHGGFIPWDDDSDIQIFYKDYEKLVDILQKEFKDTNLHLYGVDKTRYGNDNLRITHKNFEKLNLDVLYMYSCKSEEKNKDKISLIWKEYNKKYYEIFESVKREEKQEVINAFRIILNKEFEEKIGGCSFDESNLFINKISSCFFAAEKEDIFPLKLAQFEDFEFYIPNKPERVLENQYGDYMTFPKILNWHEGYFTDFDEDDIDPVITELRQLLDYKFNY